MFKGILLQLIVNSNAFLIIILTLIIAIYQVWQNLDKIKNNIISTIIYATIFIFGLLELFHFHSVFICCLKKKIKLYRLRKSIEDIDETFSCLLECSEDKNSNLFQVLGERLLKTMNKFNKIINKIEQKDNQNNTNIQINNNII